MLLSPTVNGLLTLFSICENELLSPDMQIYIKKSACVRIGPRHDTGCIPLCLKNGGNIEWSDHFKYLGVHFSSGRTLHCSFEFAKFYVLDRLMLFKAECAGLLRKMLVCIKLTQSVCQF